MFISEYLVDFNGAQAAIRAGYSAKTANRIAAENLTKPVIAQAIQLRCIQREKKLEITADKIIQEIAKIAFQDVRNLYRSDGGLIPITELDDKSAASIAGVEVTSRSGGEAEVTYVTSKIKLSDKHAALVTLARHFGLLSDKIQLSGTVGLKRVDDLTEEELLAIAAVKRD